MKPAERIVWDGDDAPEWFPPEWRDLWEQASQRLADLMEGTE